MPLREGKYVHEPDEIARHRRATTNDPRVWNHADHGEHYCTAAELIRKFPKLELKKGRLSEITKGYRTSHKGWTVSRPEPDPDSLFAWRIL